MGTGKILIYKIDVWQIWFQHWRLKVILISLTTWCHLLRIQLLENKKKTKVCLICFQIKKGNFRGQFCSQLSPLIPQKSVHANGRIGWETQWEHLANPSAVLSLCWWQAAKVKVNHRGRWSSWNFAKNNFRRTSPWPFNVSSQTTYSSLQEGCVHLLC